MTDTAVTPLTEARSDAGDDAVASTVVLQRVVMPADDGPLELLGVYARTVPEGVAGIEPLERTAVLVRGGTRASFDTFWNAFPAGYYRRWTTLGGVTLRMRLSGRGRVDVYQSSGRGRVVHHSGTPYEGNDSFQVELPVAGHFSDGGFYWFVVTARDDTTVSSAGWYAAEPLEERRATVGICTFNRPAECVATLRTLVADPDAVERLNGVVVVDQGDRRVQDDPGYAAVAAAWGGRLRVVPQRNLGGSGGFSRAMYEVLEDEAAGDVLLMDDDVLPEPESVLRATAFASASRGSVLVHGHMLDLWSRTHLHNTGDIVDYSDFSPRAVDREIEDVDLTDLPLAETAKLHRRFDSVFGGWWMCLVPRQALRQIGLSLPIFIKWDDIEYGLRAAERGYPTVTVPGIGVWHMPFHAKDVNSDWTSYFECRNRLLVALLYGDDASVRGAVLNNLKKLVAALVSMNYSAGELHHMAVEDLFRGPDFIFGDLPTVVGRIRAARKDFVDAQPLTEVPDRFDSTLDAITVERLAKQPTNAIKGNLNIVTALGAAVLASTWRGRRTRRADLTNRAPSWAVLARLDEALISAADGSAISRRVRDNPGLRRMLARAVADHVRVIRSSPQLRGQYRAALDRITDPDRWVEHFR